MQFGKIIHRLLENDQFDYAQELQQRGFTKDKIRVANKISNTVPRADFRELHLNTEVPEFALYAGLDGISLPDYPEHLVEYKTGAGLWSQEQVDANEQLTHYTLIYWLKYEELKPFVLVSINSNNGKHKVFETMRTAQQLEEWMNKLKIFKNDLESLGWWGKKLPLKDRVELC